MKFLATVLAFTLIACTPSGKLLADADTQKLSVDDIYVEVIRSEIAWADILTDDEVVEQGEQVCATVERMDTSTRQNFLADLALATATSGADPEDTGFIFGASIAAFCPEYNYLME